jgi:hypothetical protein
MSSCVMDGVETPGVAGAEAPGNEDLAAASAGAVATGLANGVILTRYRDAERERPCETILALNSQ